MRRTRYLIIGNSAAAAGCIEGIRKRDQDGDILVVTEEAYPSYSRPLISYWLEGAVQDEELYYRKDAWYLQKKAEVLLETKATAIDPEKHCVHFENGETVHYEKLLVASGSTPFIPPIEGIEEGGKIFTFTTFKDAAAIRDVLDQKSRVVILGAGLIGLKAAEALTGQSQSVAIVDLADHLMPSILDWDSAKRIQDELVQKGMQFYLEKCITKVMPQTVMLNDGTVLDYDILILAVGTRPRTELIEQAGGQTDRGIVTDTGQRTSLKDVYAAGDCTQSYDISSQSAKNLAILPNAFLQGETAGQNMAGGTAVYTQAFPVNAMGILGRYLMTAGSMSGEAYVVENEEGYKKFFIEDNRLKGYILIGECTRSGIYTDLIRQQTDLRDLDMKKLMETAGLAAFRSDERYRKLGMAH